ncbi:acyl carrier protein [Gordonia sp. CPCC 205515]|uniref:hypothetical protein n=1 Tax=Gordonia sp. CPCC 205515 TaxID=3140791 RepID=UPI003AF35481
MQAQVRDDVVNFIVTNYLFGDSNRLPGDDESLMLAGVIDSTGILELIEFLESNFDIAISEEETVPQNLDTISNMIVFVEQKKGPAELSA